MTKEDKDLLIMDLCARLPYGVKYNFGGNEGCDYTMDRISLIAVDDAFPIEDVKPYLRSMSSVTMEDDKEMGSIVYNMENGETFRTIKQINYLNKHHFDYRGLIEKGLALEAPEGMYR